MSIQCYLRTEKPTDSAGACDDMGNDLFLGGIKFTPDFDSPTPKLQAYDLMGGSGKIEISVVFTPNAVRNYLSYRFFHVLMTPVPRDNLSPLIPSNCLRSSAKEASAKSCKSAKLTQVVFTP